MPFLILLAMIASKKLSSGLAMLEPLTWQARIRAIGTGTAGSK